MQLQHYTVESTRQAGMSRNEHFKSQYLPLFWPVRQSRATVEHNLGCYKIHPSVDIHHSISLAKILTSNSVGTQLFFLGCNQDNIGGSNFITKKKFAWFYQKRKLATIEINNFLIQVCLNSCFQSSLWLPNLKLTNISSSLD